MPRYSFTHNRFAVEASTWPRPFGSICLAYSIGPSAMSDSDVSGHDSVDGLELPQTQADAMPGTQPPSPASSTPSSPPDPPRPASVQPRRATPSRARRNRLSGRCIGWHAHSHGVMNGVLCVRALPVSGVVPLATALCGRWAGVSGDDSGDEAASDGDAASLADFIAPDHEQLDQSGLVYDGGAFPEDDALDYAAIVRQRRPFAAFRRAGAADGASADAAADHPPPLLPLSRALVALFSCACLRRPSGSPLPTTCSMRSAAARLVAQIREGYLYDKEARRQAKETAGQHAGKMELTACVDYCTHILVNKLGLTWAGTTGGGALMVHDRVQRVVCLPLRLDDIFLTVQQVLLLLSSSTHPTTTGRI